jgi:hypothetical protein
MALLAVETGLRWGEIIALRPCEIDLKTRTVTVRRTIGEVAKQRSATGERDQPVHPHGAAEGGQETEADHAHNRCPACLYTSSPAATAPRNPVACRQMSSDCRHTRSPGADKDRL